VTLSEAVEVAAVEQRDRDSVALPELFDLPPLPAEQCDPLHGALDVHVLVGEIEIGRDRLRRVPIRILLEHERRRLVEPRNPIRGERLRELSFDRMRKRNRIDVVHRGCGYPRRRRSNQPASATVSDASAF